MSNFKSYVDIFDINEHTEGQAARSLSVDCQLDLWEQISKDDITNQTFKRDNHSANKPQGVAPHPYFGDVNDTDEKCATVFDLVPIDNGTSGIGSNIEDDFRKEEQLCGFLRVHKLTEINKRRRRWFVFCEDNCRLLYFKTPHDMIPRCDIDIANSSFYIQVNESGCSNIFQIRIKDDVYVLEAPDQKTMIYWLQELQKQRRKYSNRKAKSLPLKLSVPGHIEKINDESIPPNVLESVTLPRETVGDRTRINPTSNVSFVYLRDEMRKVMTGIVNKRDSSSSPGLFQNIKSKMANRTKNVKLRPDQALSQSTADGRDGENSCRQCCLYGEQVHGYKEELAQVEEELYATREITRILQKQVDEYMRQQKLKEQVESAATGNNDIIPGLLREKEKRLLDMEYLLIATQEEKEILASNYKSLNAEKSKLEEQVEAYKASLASKDSVVMTLVSELHEKDYLQSRASGDMTSNSASKFQTLPNSLADQSDLQRKILDLEDTVQGYKLQNQFLNQEIMELTKLRQEGNDMVQEMLQTCVKLETNYYDVHRKYVACLKELGKSQAEEESASSTELLRRLLQDAVLSSGTHNAPTSSAAGVPTANLLNIEDQPSLTQYDDLGFPIHMGHEFTNASHRSYSDTMDSLEQQSDEQYIKAKSIEHNLSVSMQWEQFLANIVDFSTIEKSHEMKVLIRCGVPKAHRAKLWKWCVESVVGPVKKGYGENYYDNLIEQIKLSQHDMNLNPSAKQIELDLLRTLPGNKYYECSYSGNVPMLRRVLLAYAKHDPITGYCQGLNRLAAIALLFLKEEDAFWCLIAVVNFLLPHNYFCSGMQGAHMDQRVLCDLVQEKLPALHAHFRNLGVDMTLFTFNWFLTIYIDNIPTQMYLRIWDSFLYEGSKVLFRYAVAFLKHKEHEILAVKESGELYMFMRKLGGKMIDVNKVSEIAFKELNPLSMKHIKARRQHHLAIVKAELAKMDLLRQSRSIQSSQ